MNQPTNDVCPLCKGKKHVQTSKGLVRCECVKRQAYRLRCRECGVPQLYIETPLPLLQSHSLLAKFSEQQIARLPNSVLVVCPITSLRRAATISYLIRSEIDRGSDARMFSLQQLIESVFTEPGERRAFRELLAVTPTAIIDIDLVVSHKFAPGMVNEMLAVRASAPAKFRTFWMCGDDAATQAIARYGIEACASFGSMKLLRSVRSTSDRRIAGSNSGSAAQ